MRHKENCARRPDEKEAWVVDAGFDHAEQAVLAMSRCFFKGFGEPESQAWLWAIEGAKAHFPKHMASLIAIAVLDAVQEMRRSRVSMFHFNNPCCDGCARILSEHERHLMSAFVSVRQKKQGTARTSAMMLCEGNDVSGFLAALKHLADLIDAHAIGDRAKAPDHLIPERVR